MCHLVYSPQTHEVSARQVEVRTHVEKGRAPVGVVIHWVLQARIPGSRLTSLSSHSSHLLSSVYLLSFKPIVIITLKHPTSFLLYSNRSLNSYSFKNITTRSKSRQDLAGRHDSQNWAEDKCWVVGARISESWRRSDVYIYQMEAGFRKIEKHCANWVKTVFL